MGTLHYIILYALQKKIGKIENPEINCRRHLIKNIFIFFLQYIRFFRLLRNFLFLSKYFVDFEENTKSVIELNASDYLLCSINDSTVVKKKQYFFPRSVKNKNENLNKQNKQ